MGYGSYSVEAHRALIQPRLGAAPESVFQRNDCDPAMNPRGVRYRESRDSDDHPESLAIVFALDVSASMEEIPTQLATRTLPTFMEHALEVVEHPQILIMAFGNAYADASPMQVGQFESEAALIDRWLGAVHLESGGGGWGESYELVMYFCAHHTSMDCWERREKKGYLFITGDEVPHWELDPKHAAGLIGDHLEAPINVRDLARQVQERFWTFFLIPDAARAEVEECGVVWRALLGERTLVLEDTADTALICALCIAIQEGRLTDREALDGYLKEKGLALRHRQSVLRVVVPFARALAAGPIRPQGSLHERTDEPDFGG